MPTAANPTVPTAEPWVLVPGLMCDAAVWQPVLAALAGDGGPPVHGPVQVADHGLADSLSQMARQVLQAAPPRFALAGHSMGARVALEVWRLAPGRITRLALLDTGHAPRAPGAAGDDEAARRHALLAIARRDGVAAMARQWVQPMVAPQRLADAALVDGIVAMLARRSADHFAAQIQALLARPDAGPVLATVSVPTLVACGDADSWSPPVQHQQIAQQLPAGVATLHTWPGAGHMAPMEDPAAVAASLRHWAARAPVSPG